ncbi:MAG: threonine ammonia-lyase [Burkholderiales bacterium]
MTTNQHQPSLNLADILAAQRRLEGQLELTPCLHSKLLSRLAGCDIYLKFENLQLTGSFKERGALNKLLQLSDAERAAGVLAVSAGNHAQGVAYHARRLLIPATIVMPRFAAPVKIARTRSFGAEVILHGDTFDDARAYGLQWAQDRGLTLVHPFDDPDIIAGQGTIGLEMLSQQADIDTLVVAVGGGGLIGGIAVAAQAVAPHVEIIGVQTERFPGVWNAFYAGHRPIGPATVADGIGVKSPGAYTLPLIRQSVQEILLVSEDDVELSILTLLEVEKTVVEGAGAASLAAVLKYPDQFAGKKVGLVLCGGNIAPLILAEIIQRGMVKSGRLARLRFNVHDVPGALADVANALSQLGANIDEVVHQRAFTALSVERVQIDVVIQTQGQDHVEKILRVLGEQQYPVMLIKA